MAAALEHAEQARLALRTIVAEHGPGTLTDPRTLSNLLADLLPDAPRIARILVAAAQDRIADDLREHTSAGMDPQTASRLVASSFADATMFAPRACDWVVSEIALALGLTTEEEPPVPSFSPSATARFAAGADPQVNTLPASTETAPDPALEAQGPRREGGPRPVWPQAGPGPAPMPAPMPAPTKADPDPPGAGPGRGHEPDPGPGPEPDPGPGLGPGPGPGHVRPDKAGAGRQPAPGRHRAAGHGRRAGAGHVWTAVVTADRAYFDSVIADGHVEASTIEFPAHCPPRRFELSGPQMRIGRRSVSRGLSPEIDLTGPPLDPGVSHLHAVLIAQGDGTWSVEDRGSANGTQVNGDEIAKGVPVALREGDRICLGAWTVLTVHAS
ncbi:MAG TPA: FHA domain-containing protein [Streptosporangiaceae bacterium]|nr:FHA domain-containing protein [Streptosporangiaceae bacterium]